MANGIQKHSAVSDKAAVVQRLTASACAAPSLQYSVRCYEHNTEDIHEHNTEDTHYTTCRQMHTSDCTAC
jgi:hypothetical protein